MHRLALWMAICIASTAARGETPANITRGEVALLPEYCADAQTFSATGSPDGPTDRQRRWVGMMGRTFWAVHHYCWALVSERRAQAAALSPAQRDHLLHSAVSDCYYVIKEAEPGFVLLPEIYTRIGDISVKRGRVGDAQVHYAKAREVKADYWPPYVRQAQILSNLGEKQSALQVLEAGLAHLPSQPQLLDLYRSLGGRRTVFELAPAASTPN